MSWAETLRVLRLRELEIAASLVSFDGKRVLEVGGGDGFLAAQLDRIATVESVDVQSHPAPVRPVRVYDGRTLPFPDRTFDVVFSSNVLEHIADLDGMLGEMERVLVPGGVAVHIVPTTIWRIATSLTHYAALPLYLFGRRRAGASGMGSAPLQSRNWRWFVGHVLFSYRHGETGNAATELWHFSRRGWLAALRGRQASWHPTGLFYSGHVLLGERFSLKMRSALGLSSTAVIVMRSPQ